MIIGIDPGVSGGLAYLYSDGTYDAEKMPKDIDSLWLTIKSRAKKVDSIIIEQPMPHRAGKTHKGLFTVGVNWGHIQMACCAAGLSPKFVAAQKWLKGIRHTEGYDLLERPHKPISTMSKKENYEWYKYKKNRNKELAQLLFPDIRVTLATADALLIAYYGKVKDGN